jgi:hypothetical protein
MTVLSGKQKIAIVGLVAAAALAVAPRAAAVQVSASTIEARADEGVEVRLDLSNRRCGLFAAARVTVADMTQLTRRRAGGAAVSVEQGGRNDQA